MAEELEIWIGITHHYNLDKNNLKGKYNKGSVYLAGSGFGSLNAIWPASIKPRF